MPLVRHGIVRWPGLLGFQSATYTASHGISPGVLTITCAPQASLPALAGDAIIEDGFARVRLRDCKIDTIKTDRTLAGISWVISILDRRWRWRELGAIRGAYNQPDPHGIIYPYTKKLPAELCKLCLLEMGETKFFIKVPNQALPPVNWQHTVPAVALQSLAESLGCRVVYNIGTDSVFVVPVGEGGPLPEGSLQYDGPALDIPERPDSIVLVGAPIRWQLRFRLEAVGRDWDGLYRPIDALSYRPTTGWFNSPPPYYANVKATDRLTRLQALDLAKESVFKCYRLVNLSADAKGPIQVPGYGVLLRREQVLLESSKVEQIQPQIPDEKLFEADGRRVSQHYYDGFKRDIPAECFGSYFIGSTGSIHGTRKVTNTSAGSRIIVDFSIDPTFQVVKFAQYVFRVDESLDPANNRILPVDVILETACTIRDNVTNQVLCYERAIDLGSPKFGTPPLYIHHEDVQLNVVGSYIQDTNKLIGIQEFQSGQGFPVSDTILRSSHYLTGAALKYRIDRSQSRKYNGIIPISLDGAIQQVTWSVGTGGATTEASLNTEHNVYVPPYSARLRIEYAPPAARRVGPLNNKEVIKKFEVPQDPGFAAG